MDLTRSSGLLLHLTSLPSPYGIGDLGPSAYQFVDFLAASHQRIWQVLPLVPVGYGDSPYASPSTFAGNTILISPDELVQMGLLLPEDVAQPPDFPEEEVHFEAVTAYKRTLLEKAFDQFEAGVFHEVQTELDAFIGQNADWLEDYALFQAIREAHDFAIWTDWPTPLAQRDPEALAQARVDYARSVRMHTFWQYLFDRQWRYLHRYARSKHIQIFGDLPIYVAHDSADVWSHPDLFFLNDDGTSIVVAGVPPDYFSETGQRWGNPIYRWEVMAAQGFAWWTRRFEKIFQRVDIIRLDHFRGFEAYWEIPADEPTAINGRWVQGPGASLFHAVEAKLGRLPIVAENLGLITDEVTALMNNFRFPGMAVLQFAFESSTDSYFLPHNYEQQLVAYTGTHDNDTVVGWWEQNNSTFASEAMNRMKAYARMYLNLNGHERIHWTCIRALMGSAAGLVVFPVQDLLGLGSRARMNIPGKGSENWRWRVTAQALSSDLAERLGALTRIYGRAADKSLPT